MRQTSACTAAQQIPSELRPALNDLRFSPKIPSPSRVYCVTF